MQYNVFFQLCRANGIGFDIKEKEGSLFLLRDPTKREFSTMVTVSDRLGDALALFAKNLNVLHQEASSSSTTAKENFKVSYQSDLSRFFQIFIFDVISSYGIFKIVSFSCRL